MTLPIRFIFSGVISSGALLGLGLVFFSDLRMADVLLGMQKNICSVRIARVSLLVSVLVVFPSLLYVPSCNGILYSA